jgi:hypothetical protein
MARYVSIIREPADKLADVRISLGSLSNLGIYIVFRGDPEETIQLLKAALVAAETALPQGHYEDKRGRPQG